MSAYPRSLRFVVAEGAGGWRAVCDALPGFAVTHRQVEELQAGLSPAAEAYIEERFGAQVVVFLVPPAAGADMPGGGFARLAAVEPRQAPCSIGQPARFA